MDRLICDLAERQHGVVGRRQLLDTGVGGGAVDDRLLRKRLLHLHRGVYAVGHRRLTTEARFMAAVMAGGPGAVLSHRSAAELWDLRRSARARVEITVPHGRHNRPGIQVHRGALPPDETTTLQGIPVTTVPRTLLDLAAVLPRRRVERAVNEAEVRRLGHALSLADVLARHPGRRGTATIRGILAHGAIGERITRSELEDRFLELLRAEAVLAPQVNVPVAGFEADCAWPHHRLIVELDGHASHATPEAYERDRARDRALSAAGWRVIRVTWRQLHDDGEAVARDIRRILGRK